MSTPLSYGDWPTALCKGCGKVVIWVDIGDGKAVPVDPQPAIYMLSRRPDGKARGVRADRATVMVSHFATCPKASEFSGRSRAREAAAPEDSGAVGVE